MNKIYKTVARITSLIIFPIFLQGCANGSCRMQKYDPKMQAATNNATVVIGTKNVTFIDFSKVVSPNAKPQPIAAAITAKVETAPVAEIKPEASITSTSSADPNKTSYPSRKLSDILSSKPIARNKPSSIAETVETSAAQDADYSNTYRVLKANRLFNYGYAKSIYTIEPGIYYISYAYSDENNVMRHTQASGLKADGTVEYGAFEIKAGETVYLGDIDIDWRRSNPEKMVSIGGDLATVKQELIDANHQDLAAKLQQAKFLASGYRISSN